jgi:restriction system protein
MLFKCHECNQLSFHLICPRCGPGSQDNNVPLNPEYYSEFQYRSQGLVKDLFLKRKTEKALEAKLNMVLEKYHKFENPYFVNFVHYAGPSGMDATQAGEYSKLILFQSVLLSLGFGELRELPALTKKLVRSTRFRFDYQSFIERVARHLAGDLRSTMRSWIEEQGSVFRWELPLMLHYLNEQKAHTGEISFTQATLPLIEDEELARIQRNCEQIYFETLVERFKITLEHFDASRFVTMYAVVSMDGHKFEEFLQKLFIAVGFDVELGKRTADQGADLFAEKFGRKIVIQAKSYTDSVGNAAVQQVLAAKAFYGCDEAMVVTNSYFTASAKELAESAAVKLVDRTALQTYLDDYNQMIVQAAASKQALRDSRGPLAN